MLNHSLPPVDAPAEAPELFRRLGNVVGWCLVPLAVLQQVVWLRRPVQLGPVTPTLESLLLTLIAVVTAPWWWTRWRTLGRLGGTLVGCFLALVAYSLVTVATHAEPRIELSGGMDVARAWVVIPLLTSAVTTLSALGLVLAAEPHLRPRILASAGAALVVAGFAVWPREVGVHLSPRLATAMGGSATVHVVFLLVAAMGLGIALAGRRLVGGALCLGGVLALVATMSRGGLLALVAWGVLLAVGWGLRSRRDALRLWPLGLLLAAVVVADLFIPELNRALSFADPKRSENLQSSMHLWLHDAPTAIFGTGAGQVWPWYLLEAGVVPVPESGMLATAAGPVLQSPHSTLLSIVVETGVVGSVLALACVAILVLLLFRTRPDPLRFPVACAVVASLVAFLFDSYLLRNFGVSLWWWAAVAFCCTGPAQRAVAIRGRWRP